MAFEQGLQTISMPVNADMSAKQYFIMKASAGKAAVAGAGQQPIGILQDDPAADGRAGCIGIDGISKVVAGAAISAGAYVASDANGKAVTAASGDIAVGIAVTAASADGDVISVQLMPGLGKIW
jgi:hypothetical protein